MPRPVDIAHSRKRNTLSVTWEDGTVSTFPIPYLRSWCPCAGCQGHGNVVQYQAAPQDVQAEGLFEMGAYALGIRFSDGHDAGIFSWSWLHDIAPETPPAGLKRGRFVGGTYQEPPSVS